MKDIKWTEEQKQQERLEADRLVQSRLDAERSGRVVPTTTREELIARRNAAENILSIGDVMKEVLPGLQKACEDASAHACAIRLQLETVDPTFCIEHPDQQIPFDIDACIGHSWKHNSFVVVYGDCPVCQAEKREARLRAYYRSIGIPDKVMHATFDNFDTEGDETKEKAKQKFFSQLKKGGFIFALGKWGTGKSHMAAAAIKSKGGLFVTMHDLISELRATYSNGQSSDEMIERYRTTPALALDEVSTELYDPSKKEKGLDIPPLLYRVFGYRHDKNLLSIFTSNETLETILGIFGPKLTDRMRENYSVANFTWQSHRKKMEL